MRRKRAVNEKSRRFIRDDLNQFGIEIVRAAALARMRLVSR